MDELDTLYGLLGKFHNPDNPVYMVGRRPLSGAEMLYSDYSLNIPGLEGFQHDHYIGSNGDDFGWHDGGEFRDAPNLLKQMKLTRIYGQKTYDGKTLNRAREIYKQRKNDTEQYVYENPWIFGDDYQLSPQEATRYHWLANNCQHFVNEHDKIYNDLIKNQQ